MDTSEIEARIKKIISDNSRLKPEEIGNGSNFDTELGIDSLTLFEIVLSIDREFQTNFTEQELTAMNSVDKAVQMVSAALKKTGA